MNASQNVGPRYRILARAEQDGAIRALSDVLEVVLSYDVAVEHLDMRPSAGRDGLCDIRIDAMIPNAGLSAVLRDIAALDDVVAISAESVANPSTFIVPI